MNKKDRPPFLMDDKLKKAAKECAEVIEMEEQSKEMDEFENEFSGSLPTERFINDEEKLISRMKQFIQDNFTPNSQCISKEDIQYFLDFSPTDRAFYEDIHKLLSKNKE